MATPQQLPTALANPIISLPTFFHRDGRHDLDSLQQPSLDDDEMDALRQVFVAMDLL